LNWELFYCWTRRWADNKQSATHPVSFQAMCCKMGVGRVVSCDIQVLSLRRSTTMEKVKRVRADGPRTKDGHGGMNRGPKDGPWTASTWRRQQASIHVMECRWCWLKFCVVRPTLVYLKTLPLPPLGTIWHLHPRPISAASTGPIAILVRKIWMEVVVAMQVLVG
jgi:hypothetical protein